MSYEHYSRVWSSVWLEPWTDDMRTVAFYLITGPHRRSEGLYRLPLEYIVTDLSWPSKRVRTAFDALLACGFADYDPERQLVLIINALKRNKLNPNQCKGVAKAFRELPLSPLLERFISLAQTSNKDLSKELAKDWPRVGKGP